MIALVIGIPSSRWGAKPFVIHPTLYPALQIQTYLDEEIYEEASVRNLPAFTRFLEFAGHENGNTLNYTAISMQLGVSSKTVKEYFSILEVIKAIAYLGEEIDVSFFLTSDGAEVDLVPEKHGRVVPVEIKPATAPKTPSGLRSFLRDHEVCGAYCVCRTPRAYAAENITYLPWQALIEKLYTSTLFPEV